MNFSFKLKKKIGKYYCNALLRECFCLLKETNDFVGLTVVFGAKNIHAAIRTNSASVANFLEDKILLHSPCICVDRSCAIT